MTDVGDATTGRTGPLAGVQVLELAAIGPIPFAGMVLADLGADVVRVDRPEVTPLVGDIRPVDVLGRGKRSIVVDLKQVSGVDALLDLALRADVLIEGLRPGVAERLGVGPQDLLAANPRLVYGRMTGYGQVGPLARHASHDINCIAMAGVLGRIGRAGQPPTPPLNLVGDFGGGAMLLVSGVLAALVERLSSGAGQTVDVAMVDGALLLSAVSFSGHDEGPRGTNIVDSGAPFFEAYETADGKYLAVGALEPKFWDAFVQVLGMDPSQITQERDRWMSTKARLAAAMRLRTRDEWIRAFDGIDACVSPVLEHDELFTHPHHLARGSFVEVDGLPQPAPAPRFSRTPTSTPSAAPPPGADTQQVLLDAGFEQRRIDSLLDAGAIAGTS